MADYRALNRANWDERVPAHFASPDYHVSQFIDDPAYLSHVVRFDRPLLGDIRGLRGVHLQCHIGTDTISLARLGASMTGLDYSPPAVAAASRLAEQTGADARFVQSDVYEAPAALDTAAFDLVFTGIGALCWLPSIRRWAQVVAALLRPGGRLFLREGHPMLWAMDETRPDGVLAVEMPYFEREEPLVITEEGAGTYVQTDVTFEHNTSASWNHGLGEIVTALLENGMTITSLTEHDSVPWEALPGHMEHGADDEWRLTDRPWRLPLTYTLTATSGTGAPAKETS
ncbi:MAG: class I SAM-dependent methyltransferase [Streptosporangiaceae bacterium]|jgi:SAM-dependent methyltransferase